MENINKICPLLYLGWLSFKGYSDQADTREIECLKGQCALWNEAQGQCGLLTAKQRDKCTSG